MNNYISYQRQNIEFQCIQWATKKTRSFGNPVRAKANKARAIMRSLFLFLIS